MWPMGPLQSHSILFIIQNVWDFPSKFFIHTFIFFKNIKNATRRMFCNMVYRLLRICQQVNDKFKAANDFSLINDLGLSDRWMFQLSLYLI